MLAVEVDQRVLGQLLAALARHQHLAFGDDGGGKVEDHRRLARPRHADHERRGGKPPLGAAERRHQHAARRVDEMHRHEPGLGRHLRPVADAADVSGIAQRDHGEAILLAFVDADGDGLRRHGLAEAVAGRRPPPAPASRSPPRPCGRQPPRRPSSTARSAARAPRRGCRGRSGWRRPDTCRCARPRRRSSRPWRKSRARDRRAHPP